MTVKLQDAIRWVNERRRSHPDLSMPTLLDDAARRFDLPLPDESQLRRMFHS